MSLHHRGDRRGRGANLKDESNKGTKNMPSPIGALSRTPRTRPCSHRNQASTRGGIRASAWVAWTQRNSSTIHPTQPAPYSAGRSTILLMMSAREVDLGPTTLGKGANHVEPKALVRG